MAAGAKPGVPKYRNRPAAEVRSNEIVLRIFLTSPYHFLRRFCCTESRDDKF